MLRATYPHLPVLLATGYSEALAGRKLDFHVLRNIYEIHELSQALAKVSSSRFRNKEAVFASCRAVRSNQLTSWPSRKAGPTLFTIPSH